MTKQAKNYQRLQHIVEYCEKIKVAAEAFNNSYDTFADDKNYQARDVCSFYILQIGELVGGLTDDFKAENSHIPWRAIKGMRNVVVHKYGEVDMETLWDALTNDLPKLNADCKTILENNHLQRIYNPQ